LLSNFRLGGTDIAGEELVRIAFGAGNNGGELQAAGAKMATTVSGVALAVFE